jgi:RNA polymerase-binding transcription factor DksA
MTTQEIDYYRQRLLALGARLRSAVADLTGEALRQAGGAASGQLSNTPLHMADLGSDNFEQEVAVSLLQNERAVLGDISAALLRVDHGTFGRCERCRQEIPAGRLQAIPYTPYCIKCARRLEEQEQVRSASTSPSWWVEGD